MKILRLLAACLACASSQYVYAAACGQTAVNSQTGLLDCVGTNGGTLTAVSGTTQQISAVTASGAVTLSFPSNLLLPIGVGFTASTTVKASLNIPPGATPTTPSSGDVWNLSGVLHFFDSTTNWSIPTYSGSPTGCAQWSGGSLTGTGAICGSGGVVAGTANQVTVTNGGGTATISLPSGLIFPGLATFAASTTSNPSFVIPVGVATTAHTNGAVENLGAGVFQFDDGSAFHNAMFRDTSLACGQLPAFTGDISIDTLCNSQVLLVGGSTASAVGTATVLANNATPIATANTIVLRDSAADFSAHNVTVNQLTGSSAASGRWCLNGSSSGTACITVGAAAGTPADLTLPTTNGSNGNLLSTNGAGL